MRSEGRYFIGEGEGGGWQIRRRRASATAPTGASRRGLRRWMTVSPVSGSDSRTGGVNGPCWRRHSVGSCRGSGADDATRGAWRRVRGRRGMGAF